jgi:hypothetical protein
MDYGGNFSLFALGFCTLDGGGVLVLTARIERARSDQNL